MNTLFISLNLASKVTWQCEWVKGTLNLTSSMDSSTQMDKKVWYIYTMEYYSAIKKNTFESVLMRWVKVEPIIQSEVSQKKKTPIQYTSAHIWNLETW